MALLDDGLRRLLAELTLPDGLASNPEALATFKDLIVRAVLLELPHNYSGRRTEPSQALGGVNKRRRPGDGLKLLPVRWRPMLLRCTRPPAHRLSPLVRPIGKRVH